MAVSTGTTVRYEQTVRPNHELHGNERALLVHHRRHVRTHPLAPLHRPQLGPHSCSVSKLSLNSVSDLASNVFRSTNQDCPFGKCHRPTR